MSLKNKFESHGEENENHHNFQNEESKKDIELYETSGNARNLIFIERNEKQTFLNYSYLVYGEYNNEEKTITLTFTTHSIIIKGNNLERLYDGILKQLIQKIKCVDKRYISIKPNDETIVTDLSIIKLVNNEKSN